MLDNKDNHFEIFPWSSNFETGIDEIDVQHKELLKILNRLAAHLANLSTISTLDTVFDELIAYTDYHFKTEEKIWDNYFKNDSWYLEHEKTHDDFVGTVIKLREKTENLEHEDMVRDIVSFLSKWLAYHILDTDKLMAKTVLAIENGHSLQQAKLIAQDEMSGSMRVLIDTVLDMYNTLSSTTMDLMRERTLRTRAQDELEKKNKELEELLLTQSRQATMGEMISMISHQWKQPLATISMINNNIRFDMEMDDLNNDMLEKSIADISEQVKYLSSTIDDFRDYFKPHRNLEDLNTKTFMDSVVKIINNSLQSHGIKLYINIESDFVFKGYKNELTQVILNIINNAKYVLLENKISEAAIKINVFKKENKICINIEDNGGGIKCDMDKIFQAYFTTKKDDDGTGLGLYMSKNIIEQHLNGKITAQNTTNGALFMIEMPIT